MIKRNISILYKAIFHISFLFLNHLYCTFCTMKYQLRTLEESKEKEKRNLKETKVLWTRSIPLKIYWEKNFDKVKKLWKIVYKESNWNITLDHVKLISYIYFRRTFFKTNSLFLFLRKSWKNTKKNLKNRWKRKYSEKFPKIIILGSNV